MDGDSDTERRSRALCSSHHWHAFSGEGGSQRPVNWVFYKLNKIFFFVFFFAGSDGFWYSAVLVQKQRCSQSHSLYVTLPTPNLGPRAHLSRLLPGPG